MTRTNSLSLSTLLASSTLALCTVLSLAGCPSEESDKPKTPAAEVTAKAPEKPAEVAAIAPTAAPAPTPAPAPAQPEAAAPAKPEAK